ncbi:hypothetical protein DGG96_09175 [Legionella qingyii]|uniref:FAD-binding protein n=1 Tax=Legionella qingyii TaxID=2184757 RepID=A0A317U3R3_9GAMM|nr:FAD-binding oxidoreductase [Legionella qingyii]PWY55898.1 hypothetical protein DGG96_09175 [Legionella qingyii]RUR22475.1 FAD-binding protein [Legionella qingyii]RUR27946.1 FAD-binding protein [Legionella qingyii]
MLPILKDLQNQKIKCITEPRQLISYSCNYGGPFNPPTLIVEPESRNDILKIVKLANTYKMPIAVKGFGHSTGNQHETNKGILINIKKLNRIHSLKKTKNDIYCINADSGVSWRKLINYCLNYGLMPYVFTDWLDLSLGGTISMGGIGSASFRYGIQSDYLVKASIVTKFGQHYRMDKTHHSELFNAARAGLGQFGIITSVEMTLRKSPTNCTVYKQIYTNFDTFFKDSFELIEKTRVDAIIAHFECNKSELIKRRLGSDYKKIYHKDFSRSKWLAILEVTEFSASNSSPPIFKDCLKESFSIKDYLYRIPPILDPGLEKQDSTHTEATLLFPYNQKCLDLFYTLLNQLSYEQLGFGTILFIPLKSSVIKSPFFIKPQSTYCFLLGILSRNMNTLASKQFSYLIMDFYKKALALGACRYPCDSLKTLSWPNHYGSCWEEFLKLKKTFDPNNIYSLGFSIY